MTATARFVIEEILPEVGMAYKLTGDPNLRGIGGACSGGIAAFTAAWERPDAFRRVLSFIGSFVNLRGGQVYPTLIRKTEPKPIRVYLQDGSEDLDIYAGSWWVANQDMAAAFEFAGYDAKFVAGDGAHDRIHARSVMPDALRWLWRDWNEPIEAPTTVGDQQWVTQMLDPEHGWELVSEGHGFTEGPAIAPNGDFYFTDVSESKIWKVMPDGQKAVFKEGAERASGLIFGPDGRLYGLPLRQANRRLLNRWDRGGHRRGRALQRLGRHGKRRPVLHGFLKQQGLSDPGRRGASPCA